MSSRPNLIFVFADQFRSQAMGFTGEDPVITPNFDRFAEVSMVLTHAVSNAPVCTPYRAMLMTGRYPLNTGMTGNCGPRHTMALREDGVCIGDVLSENGYATGYIGKWHLECPKPETVSSKRDVWTPPGPRRHGFDFWYAYNSYGSHFHPHYWLDDPEFREIDEWSVDHETSVALDFIRRRDTNRPFALFMSWNPPHPPSEAPSENIARYEGKALPLRPNAYESERRLPYYAQVNSCDENFGRLLRGLEEEGLVDNTIIVFSADHGEMMGSHGRFQKGIWFDESVRVPFLVRYPERISAGTDDLLLGAIDMMPTLLGSCGLPVPESVDGTDYSPILFGDSVPRPESTFIAAYPYPGLHPLRPLKPDLSDKASYDIEVGKAGADWRSWGYRGIRTHRYTYVVDRYALYRVNNVEPYVGVDLAPQEMADRINNGRHVRRWLYDNESDPYQMNPVEIGSGPRPAELTVLERELKSWLNRMDDSFPA